MSKTAKSLEIEKNLLDRDSARPIQRGSGGSNLPTTNSTLPRQSFELKNDSSLNLSTSLVEQVNHVDNDISDIDKRIQALQSYLENAR